MDAKSRHDDMVLFSKTVTSDDEAEQFRLEHADIDTHIDVEGEGEDA